MKKFIAMLLLVFMLGASFALVGCDSCNKDGDTDTDTSTNTDTNTDSNEDSNIDTDTGIVEDEHNHDLPASPSDDVSSDYEMQ